MEEDRSYVIAWRRYRTWARLRWVSLLGYVPFVAAAAFIGKRAGFPAAVPFMVAAWFLFLAVAVVGAGCFACPRCRRRFFQAWRWGNPFASRCLHCGLPKWATRDPDGSHKCG